MKETPTFKQPRINKVANRLLFLSQTVQAGIERECKKSDFYLEDEGRIGKGGFGEVWKVVHKETKKIYVIKIIDKKSIIEQKMVDQMNREIEIMYKINHPHLMKLINHFEDDDKFYLIMPFASKGHLYKLLRHQIRFDQRTAAQYMRETIEAVKYLHSLKIIHRDIKPENLLLDENYRVKLSDFGWSNFKEENENRKTYCGTPDYLAPEMIRKTGHDYTVDIWSLGVLLFEFLAGYPPFSGSNQNELFLNIKKLKINWPADFPPLAKNLISKILKLNPKERISLNEIAQHSWFEKFPPLRPVLTNSLKDEKEILVSHLINVSPEEAKNQIDYMVKPDQKRKFPLIRNNNNSHSNTELKTVVKNLTEEKDKLKSENDNLTKSLTESKKEIEKLKKEIDTTKEKFNLDKANLEKENSELTQKIEAYKAEKVSLLEEISENNNQILELKNKISNLENEDLCQQKTLDNYKEKLQANEQSLNQNLIQIEMLQSQIEKITVEKKELKTDILNKFQSFEKKISEISPNSNEDENVNNKLLQIISEDLINIKTNLNKKFEQIFENIEDFETEAKTSEATFNELILNSLSSNLINQIEKFSNKFEETYTNSKDKYYSDKSKKELIEWQKKQISELQEFKSKFLVNEAKIESLNKNLELAQKKNLDNETANSKISSLLNESENNYTNLLTKANKLEKKFSDINTFIEKQCKDKEFIESYFKFYVNDMFSKQ